MLAKIISDQMSSTLAVEACMSRLMKKYFWPALRLPRLPKYAITIGCPLLTAHCLLITAH
jgi:hypothetical protein